MLVLVLGMGLVACGDKDTDTGGGGGGTVDIPTNEEITVASKVLEKTKAGIDSANTLLLESQEYSTNYTFTLHTDVANFTINFMANYDEVKTNSQIFLQMFDNDDNNEQFGLLYDGKNLYFNLLGKKKMIQDFSQTAGFDMFWEVVNFADINSLVYGGLLADIFDNTSKFNLLPFINSTNASYREVGTNRANSEFVNIDINSFLGLINETLDVNLKDFADAEKFQLLAEKLLGFDLSRLLVMRFAKIDVNQIEVNALQNVADGVKLDIDANFTDYSKMELDLSSKYRFDEKQDIDAVKNNLKISDYESMKVGVTNFVGEVILPKLGDTVYDIDVQTDVNAYENQKNQLKLTINNSNVGSGSQNNLFASYYKNENLYIDAERLCQMLGYVDYEDFNLPKLKIENINLSQTAEDISFLALSILSTVLDDFSIGGESEEQGDINITENEELESIIDAISTKDNFISITITEELIRTFINDDRDTMQIFADMLGIDDVTMLTEILGEDFFSESKLILGYDFDTKEVRITYNLRDEDVFIAKLHGEDIETIVFPNEVLTDSDIFNKPTAPDVIKMRINASFNIRHSKDQSEIGKFFAVFIGDLSGNNTPYTLRTGTTLLAKGEISQRYSDFQGTSVQQSRYNIYFYEKKGNSEELLMSVVTNPNNHNEVLVDYRMPIGMLDGEWYTGGVKFKIDKSIIGEGLAFNGEDVSQDSIFEMAKKIIGDVNLSSSENITDSYGDVWKKAHLLYDSADDEENDPVFDLLGLKDLNAIMELRIEFNEIIADTSIVESDYINPRVGTLVNKEVESLYSKDSKWQNEVKVTFGDLELKFQPSYQEDSIAIVEGSTRYQPTAYLLGSEVSYILKVSEEGSYKISNLVSKVVIIDPIFNDTLPLETEVFLSNNNKVMLNSSIYGFDEVNIDNQGYNLEVCANEATEDSPLYDLVIGENAILTLEEKIYVGVLNRSIVSGRDSDEEVETTGKYTIIEEIFIDPYEYEMKKNDNASYDPLTEYFAKNRTKIYFNNKYKEDTKDENGLVTEYTYEVLNKTYFEVDTAQNGGAIIWDYDDSHINFKSSNALATATLGVGGNALDIAIKVNVINKVIENIQINNEKSGFYTVDTLIASTYNVPQVSDSDTSVYVIFKDSTSRKVIKERTEELTDEEFYSGYLVTSLLWNWDKDILDNKDTVFEQKSQEIQADLKIGDIDSQIAQLVVSVPQRREENKSENLTAILEIKKNIDGSVVYGDKTNIAISDAKFDLSAERYQAFEYDPYDLGSGLPQEIYLNVETSHLDSNKNYKQYPITWISVNDKGKELNIINTETGRLMYPSTESTYFVVYGLVGDGKHKLTITMRIHNIESLLTDIKFNTIEDGVGVIAIDPYLEYIDTIPTRLEATLKDGEVIVKDNLVWYVNDGKTNNWYLLTDRTANNNPIYDSNGNYIFSREGANEVSGYAYKLRYTIEPDSGHELIKQNVYLGVDVEKRTLISNTIDIFASDSHTESAGYQDIDVYKESSLELSERIKAFVFDSENTLKTGVYFEEAKLGNLNKKFLLKIDWTRNGSGDSTHSLESLYELFVSPSEIIDEFTLTGKLMPGTINEQEVSILFTFSDRQLMLFGITNSEYCDSIIVNEKTIVDFDQKDDNGMINVASLSVDAVGSAIVEEEIRLTIERPYALVMPTEKGDLYYATPYEYITYIFESIKLEFESGYTSMAKPSIDFGLYTEDTFNKTVLGVIGNETEEEYTTVTIELEKFSQGSATRNVKLVIKTLFDTLDTTSDSVIAELFVNNEDKKTTSKKYYSEDLATNIKGNEFMLPKEITVLYQHSGEVVYRLNEWEISVGSREHFDNETTTNYIPLDLIDSMGKDSTKPSVLEFIYHLPCNELETYTLTIDLPEKNINKVMYNANSTNEMFNIKNGLITIDNPLYFYDSTKAQGFDFSKLPAQIIPYNNFGSGDEYNGDFEDTEIKSYYVKWVSKNPFKAEYITTGVDNLLLAEAKLPVYGSEENQTIELYLSCDSMVFAGIEKDNIDVEKGDGAEINKIVVDPYDNDLEEKDTLVLPKEGMTIKFNSGKSNYYIDAFKAPLVRYNVVLSDGSLDPMNVENIDFSYEGAIVENPDWIWREDKVIVLRMSIPGFDKNDVGSGNTISIYVKILSKKAVKSEVANTITQADGSYVDVLLPNILYIDPYNNTTYRLPENVNVVFEGDEEEYELKIQYWEIKNNNGNESIVTSDFQVVANNVYYVPTQYSYSGASYDVCGYIATGTDENGDYVGLQSFDVKIIVLNRSAKEEIKTTHHYDDPVAGTLDDLDSVLTQNNFVNYDNYYAQYVNSDYYYSNFGQPILPIVMWDRYYDDSIITYEGFDKEIEGFIYSENRNINYLYNKFYEEVLNEQQVLIKTMSYDAFFVGGNAYSGYSDDAITKLNALNTKLNEEIRHILLDDVIDFYNENGEQETANYIQNNLILKMYKTGEETELEISTKLYAYLKESIVSTDMQVFEKWNELIDTFKAKNNTKDINNLSDYQVLKANYFDLTERYFIDSDKKINAKNQKDIVVSLENNKNAEIFNRMYSKVGSEEKALMVSALGYIPQEDNKNNTEEIKRRAVALVEVISQKTNNISVFGEKATAKISAPSMDFNNSITIDGSALNTIYFNVYNMISLVDDLQVEFIINYAQLYDALIKNCIKESLELQRLNLKGESLESFQSVIYGAIINQITPVDSNGNKVLFNADDYFDYNNMLVDPYYYDADLELIWSEYYDYIKESAITHILKMENDGVSDSEDIWNNLKVAYTTENNLKVVEKMTEIFQDVSGNYSQAVELLKVYLQAESTKERDAIKENANSLLESSAFEETRKDPTGIAERGWQIIKAGFSDENSGIVMGDTNTSGTILGDFYSVLTTQEKASFDNETISINGGESAIYFYELIYQIAQTSNKMANKAKDVWYAYMGVGDAFDIIKNNPSMIGYDIKDIVSLEKELADMAVYGSEEYPIASLSQEMAENIRKTRLFLTIKSAEMSGSFRFVIEKIETQVQLEMRELGYNNLINHRDFAGKKALIESKKYLENTLDEKALLLMIEELKAEADLTLELTEKLVKESTDKQLLMTSKSIWEATNAGSLYSILKYRPQYKTNKNIIDCVAQAESYVVENKKYAVNYLYNNIFNQEQKDIVNAINISLGGSASEFVAVEGIFEALEKRSDLGENFSSVLEQSYYYALIEKGISILKDTMREDYLVDFNSSLSLIKQNRDYLGFYADIAELYSGLSNLGTGYRLETITNLAFEEFLTKSLNTQINSHTENIKTLEKSFEKNAEGFAYDNLYKIEGFNTIFDEILKQLYQGLDSNKQTQNYDAYKLLEKKLIEAQLEVFNETTAKALEKYAYSKVFDMLNMDSWNISYIVSEANYDTALASMGEFSVILSGILDDIVITNYSDGNLTNKELAYKLFTKAYFTSKTSAEKIDKTYLHIDDLQNGVITEKSHSLEYKYARIKALIGAFDNIGALELNNARSFVNNKILEVFVGFSDITSDEQKEEFYPIIIAELRNGLLASKFNDSFGIDEYLASVTLGVQDRLEKFFESLNVGVNDKTDSTYGVVLDKLVNDLEESIEFFPSDNELNESQERHYVYINPEKLIDENGDILNNTVTEKLYISNKAKFDINDSDSYFVKDGVEFTIIQLNIKYVDFYNDESIDVTNVKDYALRNTMVIDPLNMNLPTKVQAYAINGERLYDVGKVRVIYDEVFDTINTEVYNNNTGGEIINTYQITVVVDETYTYNVPIKVEYAKRQFVEHYTEEANYSDTKVAVNGVSSYHLKSGEDLNQIVIDPTKRITVDIENNTFLLPSTLTAKFYKYEEALTDGRFQNISEYVTFKNVVWDMKGINYTLQGIEYKELRILSYELDNEDGTISKVSFDYGKDRVYTTHLRSNGTIISQRETIHAPSYGFFNISLRVEDKWVYEVKSNNKVIATQANTDLSGVGENWLVASEEINPYYPEFAKDISIVFGEEGGEEYVFTENDNLTWSYHKDHGEAKLQKIVSGEGLTSANRFVVVGFKYLSETIYVKFMTSDIKLDTPTSDTGELELIEGGTLYLLKSDLLEMTAKNQLKRFYPYLYYNFAKEGEAENWTKIPLRFKDNVVTSVLVNNEGKVYEDVPARIGTSGNDNIRFDLVVVDPKNYGMIDGKINPYVSHDFISNAINSNSVPSKEIILSGDEKLINDYFVNLSKDRQNDIYFKINHDKTVYDAVEGEVLFTCEYAMNGNNNRLSANKNGSEVLSVVISMPFEKYLYSEISSARLNVSEENIDAVTGHTFINWELGKPLKVSDLPTAIYGNNNTEIKLAWHIKDVNVNMANEEGYLVSGYYYDEDERGRSLELYIRIAKQDITSKIGHIENINGENFTNVDLALHKVYNGYTFEYIVDNSIEYLRTDGSKKPLDINMYTIMYKYGADSDLAYKTDFRPLNAGVYHIRITIENDENVFGEKIVTLTIMPKDIIGMPSGVSGVAEKSEIIVKGVEYNESNKAMKMTHNFNNQPVEVEIIGGLPMVLVANWPSSAQEKEQLYRKYLTSTQTSVEFAKSRAYLELYGKVTRKTQEYLEKTRKQIDDNATESLSDMELNAKTFDYLPHSLQICEVVVDITFETKEGIILANPPVNAGSYVIRIDIDEERNNGNYVFTEKTKTLAIALTIEPKEIEVYNLSTTYLTYNGRKQNPTVNGLHLADGSLPVGVAVNYTYTKIGESNLISGGIETPGVYMLNVSIDGGTNFSDGTIDDVIITLGQANMYIDINESQSEYLAELVDPVKNLTSTGLASKDYLTDLGAMGIETDVKDYSKVGIYDVFIGGFKVYSSDRYYYTKEINRESAGVEKDGKTYYRMVLKSRGEEGSIYTETNAITAKIAEMFANYAIYVEDKGEYEILQEEDAIVITTQSQLQEELNALRDGDIKKFYLQGSYYDSLVVNKNVTLSIVGFYDQEKNIATKIGKISILQGSLNLKIINIGGVSGVAMSIGNGAGDVKIVDSLFDGERTKDSTAIKTAIGYQNTLTLSNTIVTNYTRAMSIESGDMFFTKTVVENNVYGVFINTTGSIIIEETTFKGTTNTALTIANDNFTLMENLFVNNGTGLDCVKSKIEDIENSTNVFENNAFDIKQK